MIESMLGHMICCRTTSEICSTLEQFYNINSKARILQLRFLLQSTKKGPMSIKDYILKIKNVAECLLAVGQVIIDEELILYILGGLSQEYESVVINLTSRQDTISLQEVQYKFQMQEIRLEQLTSASTIEAHNAQVNIARFKRTGNNGGNQNYHGRGQSNQRSKGQGGYDSGNGSSCGGNRPIYQLCRRAGLSSV